VSEKSGSSSAVESTTVLDACELSDVEESEVKATDLWDILQTNAGIAESTRTEERGSQATRVGETIRRELCSLSPSVAPGSIVESISSVALRFREEVLGVEDFFDPTTASERSSLCTRVRLWCLVVGLLVVWCYVRLPRCPVRVLIAAVVGFVVVVVTSCTRRM
jgi:hypothetical protein